ncbi:Gfo/Idh/MocA family protein [Actinokineospora guangxiensis]|uniref:Gfo/Idh/MocA family protein n=1 Tax=Actinokineospora guangxiensis TaxID=1490288 RepID=A0ABW0ETX7_9PSEU
MKGSAVEVVLVGVHGFGRHQLRAILDLAAVDPEVRLVAVCDPRPPGGDLAEVLAGVPHHAALGDLPPPGARPRVTVIATPLHTHVDLGVAALRSGSHVLLEKPPASTLADFGRLVAAVEETGLACQVGFQSLGSAAVAAVRDLIAADAIGPVRGIGIAGAWQRDASYFSRTTWSGRRVLDGVAVVDGALTNPFAHSLATALAIDGSTRVGEVGDIEVELYRANAIESDDTSAVRLRTKNGATIVAAVTLCAEQVASPYLVVHGERGAITFHYKESRIRLRTAERDETTEFPETGLLGDLVARARSAEHRLIAPAEETGAFTEVLEAVRLAPEPAVVAARPVGSGDTLRHVLPGVDDAVRRCADELLLFSELGLEWTCSQP